MTTAEMPRRCANSVADALQSKSWDKYLATVVLHEKENILYMIAGGSAGGTDAQCCSPDETIKREIVGEVAFGVEQGALEEESSLIRRCR